MPQSKEEKRRKQAAATIPPPSSITMPLINDTDGTDDAKDENDVLARQRKNRRRAFAEAAVLAPMLTITIANAIINLVMEEETAASWFAHLTRQNLLLSALIISVCLIYAIHCLRTDKNSDSNFIKKLAYTALLFAMATSTLWLAADVPFAGIPGVSDHAWGIVVLTLLTHLAFPVFWGIRNWYLEENPPQIITGQASTFPAKLKAFFKPIAPTIALLYLSSGIILAYTLVTKDVLYTLLDWTANGSDIIMPILLTALAPILLPALMALIAEFILSLLDTVSNGCSRLSHCCATVFGSTNPSTGETAPAESSTAANPIRLS